MAIRIHCGIRPSEGLLTRLVLVEGGTGSPLADASLLSFDPGLDEIGSAVDALKISFVADVLHFLIDPQEATAIFGVLEPTVAQFDAWWSCDLYLTTLSLKTVIDALSETREQPQVASGIATIRREIP